MDNKEFSHLTLFQDATTYSASSETQQAEISAGQNQQTTFSGRLTTPSYPAQSETRPSSTYGEHISHQQSLTDLRVSTNTTVPPLFGSDPITDTQQSNIGSSDSLPLADKDPFRALADYQPLSFKELSVDASCFEEDSLLPPLGTYQNLEPDQNLLDASDSILTSELVGAYEGTHGVSQPAEVLQHLPESVAQSGKRKLIERSSAITTASTEVSLPLPQRKRRKNSLPQGWVIYTNSLERPFQCAFPNCKKSFKDTTRLRNHIFTHTRVSNFRCTYPECGDNRYFCDKSKLDRHIRAKHTKEKPYYCIICDRRYSRIDNFRLHLRKMHGIEL